LFRNDGTGLFEETKHLRPAVVVFVSIGNHESNGVNVIIAWQDQSNVKRTPVLTPEVGCIEWDHRSHEVQNIVNKTREKWMSMISKPTPLVKPITEFSLALIIAWKYGTIS
jgi:predicted NUDIX family NTP pyrophosphohydrolase